MGGLSYIPTSVSASRACTSAIKSKGKVIYASTRSERRRRIARVGKRQSNKPNRFWALGSSLQRWALSSRRHQICWNRLFLTTLQISCLHLPQQSWNNRIYRRANPSLSRLWRLRARRALNESFNKTHKRGRTISNQLRKLSRSDLWKTDTSPSLGHSNSQICRSTHCHRSIMLANSSGMEWPSGRATTSMTGRKWSNSRPTRGWSKAN